MVSYEFEYLCELAELVTLATGEWWVACTGRWATSPGVVGGRGARFRGVVFSVGRQLPAVGAGAVQSVLLLFATYQAMQTNRLQDNRPPHSTQSQVAKPQLTSFHFLCVP